MKRREPVEPSDIGNLKKQKVVCPFLDTINRPLLDFDFEKVCSVTLSNQNIYCCLVCGCFFQGKGAESPAFLHSVDPGHHVFMNLHNGRFFCLPDGYEIVENSLRDIKAALNPVYSKSDIKKLDENSRISTDIQGIKYLPGFVGLNNLKDTDYVNTVIQSLVHVRALRDFFLSEKNYFDSESVLVKRFGELIRKIWSPKNFKSTVDPHELLQAIERLSNHSFKIGQRAEVGSFLRWFLNELHVGLGGTKNPNSSIIYQCFQGVLRVTTEYWPVARAVEEDEDGDMFEEPAKITQKLIPFLVLPVDLPPKQSFQDDDMVIPQVPMPEVMKKFDGETVKEEITAKNRLHHRYKIVKAPKYLLLHFNRFSKNTFFKEKNPTIVTFMVNQFDINPYVEDNSNAFEKFEDLMVKDDKTLKMMLKHDRHRRKANTLPSKQALAEYIWTKVIAPKLSRNNSQYNLVSSICHDSIIEMENELVDPVATGMYKCCVQSRATQQWYEIQDLHVRETAPTVISISEANVLLFERDNHPQKNAANDLDDLEDFFQ
eukprot:TRINITY_DN9887_c0_g1_i1.p1 TRINITY_DN9887_c0_g1~~TRINITY_DN9887_c0_g1_i1.p1  ORF type:complete len:543 (+),score=93.87 TRINITY_DN9887_c0_g1_i1:46-1674(+)